MADIYIEVTSMAVNKDTKKVPTKHGVRAIQLMRDAAAKAVRGASGFTPDKKGNGFLFEGTLDEISFDPYKGEPAVSCKVVGLIATYPKKEVITKRLEGGKITVVGGTSDRQVDDCIKEAMDKATNDVISFLKKYLKAKR